MIQEGSVVILKNCKVMNVYQDNVTIQTPNNGRKTIKLTDVESQEDWGNTPNSLKATMAKLHELGEEERDLWLGTMLKAFGKNLTLNSYLSGYEQGKLEGFVEAYYEKQKELP